MAKLPCTCTSTFQDKKYGKGRRYHNKTNNEGVYRCTVCGKENNKSGVAVMKKKKAG
jgi:hypothetical protein